jgi:catechol 2,3-dioxygenase-like lactoylglutathione lyase family enzyme
MLATVALTLTPDQSMALHRHVRTHGLTHLALAVRDPKRSYEFYHNVLGVECVYDDGAFLQAQTPGSRDVIVFERNPRAAGKQGGIAHFGFRLTRAGDIDLARDAIRSAGGTITDTGEFVPGEPYVFFRDLDGYEVEIWYELPTTVDRARRSGNRTKRKTRNQRVSRT